MAVNQIYYYVWFVIIYKHGRSFLIVFIFFYISITIFNQYIQVIIQNKTTYNVLKMYRTQGLNWEGSTRGTESYYPFYFYTHVPVNKTFKYSGMYIFFTLLHPPSILIFYQIVFYELSSYIHVIYIGNSQCAILYNVFLYTTIYV